jgi:uncharacterized membrane protein
MKKISISNKINYASFIWSSAILFFTYIMASIVFPYTSWQWDIGFLLTKQHIVHLDYYRLAFYAHIFSSIFVLASGSILFSNFILKNYPALHRSTGKLYVALLLLVSAPSGFVMGFYANGGWMAQLSFFILTPLWWWFTYQGFVAARQRNFKAHKIWMLRSYALTLSAISLRIYQMLLGSLFMMDPVVQYILVSWCSWMGNLFFIEYWIRNRGRIFSSSIRFSESQENLLRRSINWILSN